MNKVKGIMVENIDKVACLLAVFILTVASTPVVAAAVNTDIIVSRAVMVDAIMDYMKATYLGEEVGHIDEEELRKVACIYYYHGQYPRTIESATGEDVTIYKPLERIVVLNAGVAEAIRALGAKDRIVGISDLIAKQTIFFPDISNKKVIGGWREIDPELVLQLDADAVVAYGKWPGPEYIEEKLPQTVTVIRLDLYKPETLRDEMLKLGFFLDEEEKASEYIKWHDKYVTAIESKVSKMSEDEKPEVFLDKSAIASTKERKTYTKASGGISTLCEVAGGLNIAEELEATYPTVDVEWILDQNPEVIVGLSESGGRGGYETEDESALKDEYKGIIELSGFGNITAVEDERVYLIDSNVPFAPGYPIGLAYMAKWFYPDEFEDLDPQAIHQEYVDKFCGIDFDVTKRGVFVYPEME